MCALFYDRLAPRSTGDRGPATCQASDGADVHPLQTGKAASPLIGSAESNDEGRFAAVDRTVMIKKGADAATDHRVGDRR